MIGIFGGTFDPVHYGHIKPALSVKQALNLSSLRFIPNRFPPHRTAPWLDTEQRLQLLKSALQDYPEIMLDERELVRDGPSYMIDTLHSLKNDFSDESLCLIIGMDAFYGITSWHRWRAIFDICRLVVTTRPGFDQSRLKAHMSAEDYQFFAPAMNTDINAFLAQESSQEAVKILLQSVPQLDISSTQIRNELRNGSDISQWMPAQTYQILRGFINENR